MALIQELHVFVFDVEQVVVAWITDSEQPVTVILVTLNTPQRYNHKFLSVALVKVAFFVELF